ncbi:GGDEF domain-containing protein [endosymbiont of Ridgeia piscesae]|jgi:diguanylate cyclase (GGDEF)-like protein|uniref:diguanylate cyclase n=1 Tax=endosymbiont of Ridgeia piscesae TaxID=54398 RepID=A0A0T5Z9K7_9GAMM|nr:GGDEF domain-containing protein [endosymbiont of Ridgeia piscesae]KRT53590.1 diguanylate cyclase (GGDEF) domain [endosymbiont of Ridgeia piscesae]KRT59556.1 diguanylate cyclase (GGDEF) domain-containing protein [endosymbiont of Ridgeia piscesae]
MDSEHFAIHAALALTRQSDGHALSSQVIQILQGLPYVTNATVYEVFTKQRIKGTDVDLSGAVVRKFCNGLSRDALSIGSESGLTQCLLDNSPVEVKQQEAQGVRLVFPVKSGVNPARLVAVEGESFSPRQRVDLLQIIELYTNQTQIIDAKERDKLTGLMNRETFENHLMKIAQMQTEVGSNCAWLAVLDIDHFKRINDTYGHLYGDEVLLQFAQLMERTFRYTDILFRFGGEEFIVLMTETTGEVGARAAAERFRETIASYNFPAVGQVTVSIGFTAVTSKLLPTDLIDQADRALYHAKENGRNRVVSYSEISQVDGDDHDIAKQELF